MAKTKTKTKEKKIGGFNINAATDKLQNELNSLIKKNVKGLEIQSLDEVDYVPYFLDSGNYALNWAISGKMIDGGFPASKIIIVYGEAGCLHRDTEIEIQVDEKLAEFLEN